MKALKIFNYALLLNACCCFGFLAINGLYFFKWNWLVAISFVVTFTLFMILTKWETRLKLKKEL